MKKRLFIAITLLTLLTTVTINQKLGITILKLKEIRVENNFYVKDKEIRELLKPIYGKNLFLLKNDEIKKLLVKNSLIESLQINKKYPNTLKIKITEKKPIAILFDKKNKFYLSEKIDLIEPNIIIPTNDLPHIFGNRKDFKIFYNNLKKINFPFKDVKKLILYESDRWDVETINKKIIKLPSENYLESLENYLNIYDENEFRKYNLFDYRVKNQLILN